MEVKLDTSKLLAQLQAFEKEATRRMEKMVEGFAYQLTMRAIDNTPMGDSSKWFEYYQARTDLPKEEGIAQGNWQFSKSNSFQLQMFSGQQSGLDALISVASESVSYKLGDTFYIGNAAPYIGSLEHDYSTQTSGRGIIKPTVEQITGAYAVNLQHYYKKG
jgi:hypothetical protein